MNKMLTDEKALKICADLFHVENKKLGLHSAFFCLRRQIQACRSHQTRVILRETFSANSIIAESAQPKVYLHTLVLD